MKHVQQANLQDPRPMPRGLTALLSKQRHHDFLLTVPMLSESGLEDAPLLQVPEVAWGASLNQFPTVCSDQKLCFGELIHEGSHRI